MKKLLINILLLLALTATAAPKLTVFAVVDGLDAQSMQDLRAFWGAGGMRTLAEEAFQTTVCFPHLVYGGNETTASILTGQTPYYSGFAADTYYSRSDRKAHNMLEDSSQKGINSRQQLSPANLKSLTLADEFRLQEGSKSKVYAIGIDAYTTILLAGHAANACCWIESAEAGWASTAFYTEGLPSAADQMNTNGRFQELVAREWTNRLSITNYLRPTQEERKKDAFSYETAKVLHHSTIANTLVTELALAIQKDEKLGEDNIPDLLMLEYNLVSPKAKSARIASAEQEDMYICLNQDLGYLMEQLTKRLGKDNYQVVLVGKPVMGQSKQTLNDLGFHVGNFNIDRAAALVGTYLMAIYGHERWVDGGYGNSIYLNRTLIEQKKMSLTQIQRQVADFLMEMEGVLGAYPCNDVAMLQGDDEVAKLRNSITRRSGDIIVALQQGWTLMNDEKRTADYILDANPTAPIYWWSGAYRTFPTLPTPLPSTQVKELLK